MQHDKPILNDDDFRVGILGGGQLGKMLALAAANWHLPLHLLDKDQSFPAGMVSRAFHEGDFKDYDDVMTFGKAMDVLSIEIEHVNTAAMADLERRGVSVHPHPATLDIIKDKGRQKQFYADRDLPTSLFTLYDDARAIREAVSGGELNVPFVQKSRTAGYDGRGVAVIRNASDLEEKLLPGASLVEPLVDIDRELAVIVARRASGEIQAFPTVEMTFHPEANLVEFLICPARISEEITRKAESLAKRTMEAFDLCGLLAVELFLTQEGELLINEVAPRPHNSGHHTIDSCYTSQFEQHLRAILNLPLGSTQLKSPAVMVNVLGAPGHTGQAHYEGLAETLGIPGIHLHLYGKSQTRPFRKMGHATLLADHIDTAIDRARKVQQTLSVVARG